MTFPISKRADAIGNEYYEQGQELEDPRQDNEAPDDLYEEMEARDMEGYTPGQDNVIIDKNDMHADVLTPILAELQRVVILREARRLKQRGVK